MATCKQCTGMKYVCIFSVTSLFANSIARKQDLLAARIKMSIFIDIKWIIF